MMYFQTSDRSKVVAIAPGDDYADVISADVLPLGSFNLVNTCTAATMRKVREAARAAGLKLRHPQTMAVR